MKFKSLTWIITVLCLVGAVQGLLTDNLQAYYKLDENVLTSETGVFNLTNAGTTNSTGKINSGRNYVGNQEMDVDASTTMLGANGTINVWFNLDDVTSDHWIIGKWIAGNYEFLMIIDGVTSDKLQICTDTCSSVMYSTGVVATAIWTMATVTWKNGNWSLYMNGVYNNSMVASKSAGTSAVSIGRNPDGDTSHWDGNLDEIGFWTQPLSQSEITQLYNAGTGLAYPFTLNAPVIDNRTYNFSSALYDADMLNWRNGNESGAILTRDDTPTVRFNTTNPAYCRIGTADQNWTTMGNTRNCTTTGNLSHVCTLPAADALTIGGGYQSLYIGCIEETFANETALSTSGALNVSMDLYEARGTTKDGAGTELESVVVSAISQPNGILYANTTSNSTGGWSMTVHSGNWTFVAFHPTNSSLDGDTEAWVSVP